MKPLLKILAAFIVIIITFFITDVVFGKITDSIIRTKGMTKQMYVMSSDDSYDLIFIGSSRANHHYDTPFINDSIGISSFNAGEDGRGLTYQYPVLKEYLKKNNPKLVVLELASALDGNWNDHISILYPLSNKYNSIIETAAKIDPYNRYYLMSNLYRYNSNLIGEFKSIFRPFKASKTFGFSPISINETSAGFDQERILSFNSPIDSVEYNILIDLIKMCQKKHVNLVGIMSPIVLKKMERPNVIDSIFKTNGVPLIDNTYFRLDHEPKDYFKDAVHLNEFGAREYTKYVMHQLTDSLKLISVYPDGHSSSVTRK